MRAVAPCKDCQSRTDGCRKECKAWRTYEIAKGIVHDKKMRALMVRDYYKDKSERLSKKLGAWHV